LRVKVYGHHDDVYDNILLRLLLLLAGALGSDAQVTHALGEGAGAEVPHE